MKKLILFTLLLFTFGFSSNVSADAENFIDVVRDAVYLDNEGHVHGLWTNEIPIKSPSLDYEAGGWRFDVLLNALFQDAKYTYTDVYDPNTYVWLEENAAPMPSEEELKEVWEKIRYDTRDYSRSLLFTKELETLNNDGIKIISIGYNGNTFIALKENGYLIHLSKFDLWRRWALKDPSFCNNPDEREAYTSFFDPDTKKVFINRNGTFGIKFDGTIFPIYQRGNFDFPAEGIKPARELPIINSDRLDALGDVSTQPADAVASYTAEVDPGFAGVKVNVKKKTGDEIDIFSILLATNGNNVKYFASIPVINQGEGTFSVQIKKETFSSKDVQKWFMWWAYYVREPVTTTESYVETRTLQPERAR